MRMKGYVFLIVSVAISEAFSLNPNGPEIVDVGEDKDIPDINKDILNDDILEPANMQRSTIINENMLWTSPVPYVLNNDLEINSKGVILRALDQFRLKSCIDFKPRDSEDYYISVKQLSGCWSYVGRIFSNGQELSIGIGCGYIAYVEHEFLHALGFYHEQSRYDRDDYVTIKFENIIEDKKSSFGIVSSTYSTNHGVPYDYLSVMHSGKDDFTNGNGSTIITKDPKFQNLIGQRVEMSTRDAQELNLLYKCSSSIAFMIYCGFTNGTMCQMNRCSQNGNGWEMVTGVYAGPSSDHTNLPSGNVKGQDAGYFMYASTVSGQEGDSAWLESKRMSPQRKCHVQCLQFYYYHNGSKSDKLNIWIREFQNEWDSTGTLSLMGQITGPPTSHWTLHHVPLNATKQFQVEFEVRKRAGNSTDGFSIDDINLSELECPEGTWQINDFERLLNTTATPTLIYSPKQYSSEGYAYRVALYLLKGYFGVYLQLVSGVYDDQLKWPCSQRQFTVQMVDQNPNIQLQMSRQMSFTTDPNLLTQSGVAFWGKPRKVGTPIVDENNEIIYVSNLYGRGNFASLEDIQSRDYLKGGSAIFVFSLQDLTPLINGSALPCPQVRPVNITNPPGDLDKGPYSSCIFGFSPGMMASPVLTVLLALMLLIP